MSAPAVAPIQLLGVPARPTDRYWERGVRCYGDPDTYVLVRLYWPTSDPKPRRSWWP
jgi:hypothetical protein